MKFDGLDEWDFSVDEVSNSVYQISAVDNQGRKVEMTGTDVGKLISNCKAAVLEFDQEKINEKCKKPN